MLLPSLNKARDMAKRANCANNQKQIGTALAMYALSYNDYFPRFTAPNWGGPYWFNFLSETLPSGKVHHVDSSGVPNTNNASFFCSSEPTHNSSLIDYGVNFPTLVQVVTWTTVFEHLSTKKITNASSLITVGDSRQSDGAGGLRGSFYLNRDDFLNGVDASVSNVPYPPRHGNGMNFLFHDGHVQFMVVSRNTLSSFYDLLHAKVGQVPHY